MPDDGAFEEDYVQVGTWLLPEAYGDKYDHFTQTRCDVKRGVTIPLYAKASDLIEGGRESLVPRKPE